MEYLRKATSEDMVRSMVDFKLPLEVKKMLVEKKRLTPVIVREYRKESFDSLRDIKSNCKKFLTFIRAYEDFVNGKDVYIKY